MKKILSLISIIALSFSFVACEGLFDNLEGDKSKLDGEYLAQSEAGLSRMMASVYASIPMGAFSNGDKSTDNAVDTHGGGIYNSTPGFWNYTTMRDVNNLIKIVEKAYADGTISESLYTTYIAEARFVRAYYYFGMVRTYGGVPIITEPLDDKFGVNNNEGLYIPRSTEKDTWDFVLSELDAAAEGLPETRTDGAYRADKWAALGLKSRVALYAASVSKYWKNAPIETSYQAVADKLTYMEESYANDYYQQCIDACEEIINSGKFSLYNAEPASLDAAITGLSDLFLARHDEEWIFGRSYNNGTPQASNSFDWNNSPMQAKFSEAVGVWKWGCYNVNADLADLYPYYDSNYNAVDGTLATRVDGNESTWLEQIYADATAAEKVEYVAYSKTADLFAKKDARFQAWVIYPGINFRGVDIVIQGGIWGDKLLICDSEKDYVTAGGKKYYMYGASNGEEYSGFNKIGHANDGSWYSTGFGIRKYLDPAGAKQYSTNPWYDIRYTEILLNYIEAQVEKNGTNAGDAKKHLNAIRRRAFFKDEIDATLENVLKERRLELAFEDDRAMTLHRRREFYRPNHPAGVAEARRHAVIPVADVRSGKAQYIFVRANMMMDDTDRVPVAYELQPKNYYGNIPNYAANKLVPNPSQL
mgnify:CR=1 FL=1